VYPTSYNKDKSYESTPSKGNTSNAFASNWLLNNS